jgi:VCBS repeat-containing protein
VAQSVAYEHGEDGLAASYSFLATDVDHGAMLSYEILGQPEAGAVINNGDGTFSFDPAGGFESLAVGETQEVSFDYRVTDEHGAISEALASVTVVGANDLPVAEMDSIVIDEDTALHFDSGYLLINDHDVDASDVLSVISVDSSQVGATVSFADGQITYDIGQAFQQLAEGEVVHDSFSYIIADSNGAQAVSLVNIDILGTNDAPITVGDVAATVEDEILPISGNVLANDSDVDNGTLLQVVAPGDYIGIYGTLTFNAYGSYLYSLNNDSLAVQSLAQGSTVVDQFTYNVSDGIVTVSGNLDITVTGSNDAPVVAGDSALLIEDMVVSASGNVLANDSDVDAGTTLVVADPATRLGSYGTLSLAADGSYVYSLDNASNTVQSLGRGAMVAEHFSYTATDGIASVASALDITLTGSNDAPILVAPLVDRQVNFHKDFSWQMPAGSFVDPDQGDTLSYRATLADGSALPIWLAFDAATQTFSGQAPKQVCSVEVKVTATDKVAATGSTEGSLSTSDVFLITVSHGNEGVGNGEDAPPTGHDDNYNDGPGTVPGNPGRRRDHDGHRSSDREGDRSDDWGNDRAWGQSQRVQPAYLNASHWNDAQAPETAKSGEQVDPSVVFGRWLTIDLAVSKALAEKKTLSWLDERLGADTTALSKASAGFLGSTTPFGSDLFSLQAGHGQELKGFKGLSEGLRKVA